MELISETKASISPRRIMLVEGARGAAAVYVFLGHIVLIGGAADWIKFGKFIFYPLTFGQEAVLLFFFLSGFSIHYSSHNRPFDTFSGIGKYYYLRVRRLYPIFLVAVSLSIVLGMWASRLGGALLNPARVSAKELPFVLLFLSDFHSGGWHRGLVNNPALWSLSYEIPYYVVYPLFWRCSKSIGIFRSFLLSLTGSAGFIVVDSVHNNHLSNVFSLYWLWAAGAVMAEWRLKSKSFVFSPIAYGLILFLSYVFSQSLEATVAPVIVWNLKALTIGIMVLSAFIHSEPTGLRVRVFATAGLVTLLVICLYATRNVPTWGRHVFLDARLVFACLAVALLLLTESNILTLSRALLKYFERAGSISYALYVVHMPILYFVAEVLHRYQAASCLIVVAALPILALAWWLELRFQRAVCLWLDNRQNMAKASFVRWQAGANPPERSSSIL
jgi:peptidoglycan/LPS O-acetylase OafA/YrhL